MPPCRCSPLRWMGPPLNGNLMDRHTEEQIGEIPLELKADLDAELVEEFISDAREQLENIEQGTLALEKNPLDQEVIHTFFRAFHTFKGNAGFLDLTAI